MGDAPGREPAALGSRRRAALPPPTLPLIYLTGAHLSLVVAFAILTARPDLPGPFFYHPKALAVVHLVTLGGISGTILGALYIVGPLVLGVPMRAAALDAVLCLAFWLGTTGIVAGFWSGRFELVGASAALVLPPLGVVGGRVAIGLRSTRLPFGVTLHLWLAVANVLLAGLLGAAAAINRATGVLPLSPMSVAAAHAHLALLGWAAMMILGVGYRLIPMFAPGAMPTGPSVALSAVLLEIGTLGLTVSLAADRSLLWWAIMVAAAFAAFLAQIAWTLRERRPGPVELPKPDWSTWHSYVSMACLAVAIALGIRVAAGGADRATVWAYGTIGVLGFAVQMIAGIAGRLLPMQAWYRALERRDGVLPPISVHRLIEPRLAGAVLLSWLAGLPLLTIGLAGQRSFAIAFGAAALLAATVVSAWHAALIVHRAQRAA